MDGGWTMTFALKGLVLFLVLGCSTDPAVRSGEASRRIGALEEENAELREWIEVLEARLGLLVEHFPGIVCEFPPPIDAIVIDVDRDLKLVILDKGRKDDVVPGYEFTV